MSTETEFIEFKEHDMHIRAVVLQDKGSKLVVQPVAAFLSGQWVEFSPNDTAFQIDRSKIVAGEAK